MQIIEMSEETWIPNSIILTVITALLAELAPIAVRVIALLLVGKQMQIVISHHMSRSLAVYVVFQKC